MCYLLVKPRGEAINPDWLNNAHAAGNGDGFGMVYVHRGRFVVNKTMEFAEFMDIAKHLPVDKNVILHMRMASTGAVCLDNCHPFEFDDLCGAHNGVLPGWGSQFITDTEHFMTESVKSLSHLQKHRHALGSAIGGGKMAFLTLSGEVEFLNRERGVEESGCWHSNSYYKPFAWESGRFLYDGPEESFVDDRAEDGLLGLIESMESQSHCVPESLKSRFNRLLADLEYEYYITK